MVNLTVEEALAFVPTLKELMATKLPIRAAYKIARFARLVEEQLKDFHTQRIALIKEMGVQKENGDTTIPAESMEEFYSKLKAILPEGIAVAVEPLSIDDLGNDVVLTPQQMVALENGKLLRA